MALVSNDSDQVPSPNHATSEFSSHALNPASTVLKSSIDASLSAEEGPATPNVTSSFPSISIATPTIANDSSYKTSPEVVSLGRLTPREMFASENEDAIRQEMDKPRVGKSDSGLNEGGLRKKTLDELWKKADKNLCQSKIDNLEKDIDASAATYLQVVPVF
jgi:hypothetical protein